MDAVVAALVLNFAAVAGAIIRQAGYSNVSRVSQIFGFQLIWGGIFAGFMALYCLVMAEGWLAGIGIWCVTGFLYALIAIQIRARWDALLTILGTISLVAGVVLFYRLNLLH